jgi:replicative DNA helicase
MGTLSAASAKRVRVNVRGNWSEPVNLWLMPSLGSGSRKSSVVNAATKPLKNFEDSETERMRVQIAQAKSRRSAAEKKVEAKEKELSKHTDASTEIGVVSDLNDLVLKMETDPALQAPAPPRYLVDDISPEKLADMTAEQGGRMAVLSPEGGIFQVISGRYSEADSLDFFLKAHAGDDMPVDRMHREGKHLKQPALTLALAVQPEVLSGIAKQPGFRGRGLLARFAYGCPINTVGGRQVSPPPPPVPRSVYEAYANLIQSALSLPIGVTELEMDEDADAAHLAYEAKLEPRLGPDGDLEHLTDWAGKLAGLVARWAGLFHVAKHIVRTSNGARLDQDLIEEESIATAIEIAETFLIPHAKTAFSLMGADPALEGARYVLRSVAKWPKDEFKRRDLHQSRLKTRFPRPDQLDRPLALLEEFGYIRQLPPIEKTGAGRKPSPVYTINPLVRSLNTLNPLNTPSIPYLADSAYLETPQGAENASNGRSDGMPQKELAVNVIVGDSFIPDLVFDDDDWNEEEVVV